MGAKKKKQCNIASGGGQFFFSASAGVARFHSLASEAQRFRNALYPSQWDLENAVAREREQAREEMR